MKETELIKNKLDIVDLIGEYLQLKPAGSGSFKANCPFHQEKTPSFFVSKSKQIWHCFGCGMGGDQFEFVQRMEGMEFPEALEFLAGKAGVELPKFDREQSGIRKKLIEINELASKYYYKILQESQAAEKARAYIKERKLDDHTVEIFRLGYAPDKWEVLLEFLKKRGYSEDEINQAGLVSQKEGGRGYYDRFRNRLMFPIWNHQAKAVGFTARLLDPEAKEAKYVNTPQTKIYNKSEILYGLDKAKRMIGEKDLIVVVEGNMDVITSHKVGISNVVASSGTALTEQQVNIIQRYTNNIAFAFDADSAGQAAAKRGIDMALAHGLNVGVIILKDAKDPDELINKDPALWQKAIDERVDVMTYYFNQAKKNYDLKSPQGKKDASEFLLVEIAKLSNQVEQTHWIQELGRLIDVSESVLRESLPRVKSSVSKPVETKQPAAPSKSVQAWSKLISILINRPELIVQVQSSFHPEYISEEGYQQLYRNLILFYNEAAQSSEGDSENSAQIYSGLVNFLKQKGVDETGVELFHVLALAGERDWRDLDTEQLRQELLKITNFAESIYKQAEKARLTKEMREAEAAGDKNKVEEILSKFKQLD